MRQFLIESVLPLAEVGGAIVALTLILFDVPAARPRAPVPAPALSTVASARLEDPYTPKFVTRDQLDATLGRALRMLETARVNTASPGAPPSGQAGVALVRGEAAPQAPTAATPDPQVMLQAVSTLGQAIKAARDARTEEDLVRAEEQLRAARQQMEATCGAPGSPLCDSAKSIRSLGY